MTSIKDSYEMKELREQVKKFAIEIGAFCIMYEEDFEHCGQVAKSVGVDWPEHVGMLSEDVCVKLVKAMM